MAHRYKGYNVMTCHPILSIIIYHLNVNISRYGPVQSVKHLPCKDGEVVSAVQVAFMDIKSAKKALQTTHHLEER